MEPKTYDLPDAALLDDESSYRCMVWEPGFVAVILGQANNLEESVYPEALAADQVPVYKRPSGGESVVLSPKTLVISILKRGDKLRSPRTYFQRYNQGIIDALAQLGVEDLRCEGISDICIGKMKILGSSIYRNKDVVMYHAVLNRGESAETFERYLKHPTREPGYRSGRSHAEFVTSLEERGYRFNSLDIRRAILRKLGPVPGLPLCRTSKKFDTQSSIRHGTNEKLELPQ